MKGESLFEVTIQGDVSTNSNRDLILGWRGKIERSFASLPLSKMDRKKVSVMIKFWISSDRLQSRRNDLDNLVKPVLDGIRQVALELVDLNVAVAQ